MKTKTVIVLGGAWTSLQSYKLSIKNSALFRGVFGIFCSVSKLLFIYLFQNSLRNPVQGSAEPF